MCFHIAKQELMGRNLLFPLSSGLGVSQHSLGCHVPWVDLGLFLCGRVMQQKSLGHHGGPQVLLPVNTLRIKSLFSISDEVQLLSRL